MKSILVNLLAFVSISVFAQDITGGNGAIEDPFQFNIIGKAKANYTDTVGIKTDQNDNVSDINCKSLIGIGYRNTSNDRIDFIFENVDKCRVVLACVNKLETGEAIQIMVDRNNKKIKNVILPASCALDPWAFVGDDESTHKF